MPTLSSVSRAACVLLAACTGHAASAEGLRPPPGHDVPWSRWQARVMLDGLDTLHGPAADTALPSGGAPRSLSLMGDYVFARRIGSDGQASALRATSGVVFGQRSTLWLGAPGQSTRGGIAVDRRLSLASGAALPGVESGGSLPYVGLGYSALNRSGWQFSADFGLLAMGSASPVRLGRAFSNQGVDELLREMRLSPVLQVGASYAF